MSLPAVGDDSALPRVIATNSGQLTRDEADAVFVSKTGAVGYADILTKTAGVAKAASPLYAQRATLAHTDVAAKDLFTLPAGAIIIDFVVNVTTAFNAGDSNMIDIGDGTTANRFVNDKAGGSAGISLAASADEAALAAATVVKGIYVPGGAAATAGAATITVLYIVP